MCGTSRFGDACADLGWPKGITLDERLAFLQYKLFYKLGTLTMTSALHT